MQISTEPTHPIMQLHDDILNFLEAIDPQPGSELNITGFKFTRLIKELHDTFQMEYNIEHMESCYHIDDFIKPSTRN